MKPENLFPSKGTAGSGWDRPVPTITGLYRTPPPENIHSQWRIDLERGPEAEKLKPKYLTAAQIATRQAKETHETA